MWKKKLTWNNYSNRKAMIGRNVLSVHFERNENVAEIVHDFFFWNGRTVRAAHGIFVQTFELNVLDVLVIEINT